MIRDAISRLVEGKNLSRDESASVMTEIMEGQVTPAQIGAFLTALRLKGETPEEITGLAPTMRQKATRINPGPGTVVDCDKRQARVGLAHVAHLTSNANAQVLVIRSDVLDRAVSRLGPGEGEFFGHVDSE